jgi:hypothetical protein
MNDEQKQTMQEKIAQKAADLAFTKCGNVTKMSTEDALVTILEAIVDGMEWMGRQRTLGELHAMRTRLNDVAKEYHDKFVDADNAIKQVEKSIQHVEKLT